jgi:hypothetical protein
MKVDQSEIDAWLEMYEGDIAAPGRSLAVILERGLRDRIAYVFERAARACLVKGSVLIRTRNDYSGARACFSEGAEMGLKLSGYSLQDAPRQQWDFYFALCDGLLSRDFNGARLLAQAIYEAEMPPDGDFLEWQYGFSMLLAATVKQDELTFRRVQREVTASEKENAGSLTWWKRHEGYVALWLTILDRDCVRFDEQIALCNRQFQSRAKDKSLADVSLEDGGCDDNQYVVDYMGLAALMLARYCAMDVKFDSPSVPLDYVRFAEDQLR